MNMPPRWGFSSFEGGGYIDVAPPVLKSGRPSRARDVDTARERMSDWQRRLTASSPMRRVISPPGAG
jgi:hypothetical protein